MRLFIACLLLVTPAAFGGDKITSSDGREIEADIMDVTSKGVLLRTRAVETWVEWERLDADCAFRIKAAKWLEVDKDKFASSAVVRTKSLLVAEDAGEVKVHLLLGLDPKPPLEAARAALFFIRVGEDWRWLNHHPVHMLIDGEKTGEMKAHQNFDTLKGGDVIEIITVLLTWDQLTSLANAKVVEARVGLTEMTFPPEVMTAAGAFQQAARKAWGMEPVVKKKEG